MRSNINININGYDTDLPEDFEMSFVEKNPFFYDVEMYSEPVRLPVERNRQLLENIDSPESGKRPVDFEMLGAQVEVGGIPVRHGYVRVNNNSLVDGFLNINIDAAAQSFDDLIGDMTCQEVPVKDELIIGRKIGHVKVDVSYLTRVTVKYRDGKKEDTSFGSTESASGSATFDPQALGFSYPGLAYSSLRPEMQQRKTYPDGNIVNIPIVTKSFINVSHEYGDTDGSPYTDAAGGVIGWPFCNSRIAYMHKGLNEDGTSSSSLIKKSDNRNVYESMYPYWVLDADRQQSGICFYVLYFLDCLFAHLGVTFDNTELYEIADLRRLAFFTTHCKYYAREVEGYDHFTGSDSDLTYFIEQQFGISQVGYKYGSEEETMKTANAAVFGGINSWLDDMGCGGQLQISKPKTKSVESVHFKDLQTGESKTVTVGDGDVAAIEIEAWIKDMSVDAEMQNMYATSDNFPDASVKDVLSSLEASFGIRFHYDYEKRHVKAYVLRNVFRNSTAIHKLNGTVTSVVPMVDLTSGVRMKYAAESAAKEQRENIRRGIRDYDTDYDYIDYPSPDAKGGKTIVMDSLTDIKQTQRVNNVNVYIDRSTGNAYRWKIDADALESGEVRINLFEVGQFKGVEIGDCSKQNEDNIVEFESSFVPVPFNNVTAGMEDDMAANGTITYDNRYRFSNINSNFKRTYAPFIDEDMEHEFVEHHIDNLISSTGVDVYCTEVLKLVESYDPTSTDDGNSPLQHYDWGLAIAIMRGGGTNMTVQHYDYNFDFFGNSKWKTMAGNYAMSSDSMTPEGEDYDYDGDTGEGDGGGERLSLKIRAYKQPSWSDVPLCDGDVMDDEDPTKIARRIKSRGLADNMMADYIWFIMHRKKVQIKMLMTPAELIDLPNHFRERCEIDGMTGLIDQAQWSVSVANGLSEVTIDFFYI